MQRIVDWQIVKKLKIHSHQNIRELITHRYLGLVLLPFRSRHTFAPQTEAKKVVNLFRQICFLFEKSQYFLFTWLS